MSNKETPSLRIAVVGACASGKSTLVSSLLSEDYEARHVAQDHSFVPDMWQRISQPDILIFLDVDYETIKARRPKTTLRPTDLVEQERRLSHARDSCDLLIDTNPLTTGEVLRLALSYLENV